MGSQDRKKTGRFKTWLIYVILAIVAFFPLTAFTSPSFNGAWQTSFMQNGAPVTVYLTLNNDGTAMLNKYAGIYQVVSQSMNWSTDGDIICFFGADGSRDCGNVRLSSNRLAITMGGQTLVYSRNSSEPSFTGSQHCCECSCPGWVGGGKNGTCAYKNCGHKYSKHANSWGCLQH